MSMSDCPECWETPCLCGYEYKQEHWTIERLKIYIEMLQKVLEQKMK